MSNGAKIIVALVVVALIGLGAFFFTNKDSEKNKTPASSGTSQGAGSTETGTSNPDETVASTITYDGSSFSLSTASVMSGSKVKVVNSSSGTDLSFHSDPHPQHTDNPDLNVGDLAPGESKTITLTNKGTWGFHNHLNPSQKGEITVE